MVKRGAEISNGDGEGEQGWGGGVDVDEGGRVDEGEVVLG